MRWAKLLRDLGAESGRALLMLVAVAVALFGVSAMLGAYGIVTREVRTNYMSTNPASATIDVDNVTASVLEIARSVPGIADAEARSVVEGQVKVGDAWMRALLFVVDDFSTMRMNLFTTVAGNWPPPEGSILMERLAKDLVGVSLGAEVQLKVGANPPTTFSVSGFVHDTTLAPAWQEQTAYGYMTMATFERLSAPAKFEELRILVAGTPSQAEVDAKAREVASALASRAIAVHAIKAPPIGQHPHQGQIATGLGMFLVLALLGLVLAAILVAAVLAASLARQSREIGIMKAVGATSSQIASMYLVLLLGLGAAALLIGLPAGAYVAGGMSRIIADTMNFTITDATVPSWVYLAVTGGGLAIPLAAGLPAIIRASRITVREALTSGGATVSGRVGARSLAWLGVFGPTTRLAMRNAFRRRGRLILSVALLAVGGSLFVTALSAREGWRSIAASVLDDRHYDAELRLSARVDESSVVEAIRHSGTVSRFEMWGTAETAYAEDGGLEIMRTYPDKGHGSFALFGAPGDTGLVTYPMVEGDWLSPDDQDGLVLAQRNHRSQNSPKLGEKIVLSLGGRPSSWTLVGVVQEIGGGGAYVNKAAFDRAAGGDAQQMIRVLFDRESYADPDEALGALYEAFDDAGIGVERTTALTALYEALMGHVEVPVTMLVLAAVLLGAIGGLGLASMTTINVVERTREIGVLKAIGATPGTIVRLIMSESAVVAALSWIAAILLALPLIQGIAVLGASMFGTPLPFIVSLPAASGWLALVVAVALIASAAPASRAGRLMVREALSYT